MNFDHNKNDQIIHHFVTLSFRPPCELQELPKSPFELLSPILSTGEEKGMQNDSSMCGLP